MAVPERLAEGQVWTKDDFSMGRVLGTGSFGRVSLATHKEKGFVCAIKALSKAHIIKNQQASTAPRRPEHLPMQLYLP